MERKGSQHERGGNKKLLRTGQQNLIAVVTVHTFAVYRTELVNETGR